MSSLGPSEHEPSALLSDEALSAVELREQPFLKPESPADTFSDEVTADQLADIKQALITGDDLLLILGEPGIGKSTLLAQLGDNSGLRIQCFSVQGSARFSAVNLFGGMLEAFKREPPDNLKTMLDELVPCLQGMISNNTLSAVVIDDADAVDAIEMTRLLSAMLYMNSQDDTLMRIALSAPPEFEQRIPELLPEGADLPYSTLTIEPFEHERAAHYLAWRFERVGDTPGLPFDEAQIVDMNQRADGHPRRLHEIIADELNAQHGELEPAIPPELLTSSRSEGPSLGAALLGGRSAKMLFGGLGILLIALGLLLFLPGGNDTDDRYAVVEQRGLDEDNADRLALVDEEAEANRSSTSGAATDEENDAEVAEGSAAESGVAPEQGTELQPGDSASAAESLPDLSQADPSAADQEAASEAAPDVDDANTESITVIEESAPSSDTQAANTSSEATSTPSDEPRSAAQETESGGENPESGQTRNSVESLADEPTSAEAPAETASDISAETPAETPPVAPSDAPADQDGGDSTPIVDAADSESQSVSTQDAEEPPAEDVPDPAAPAETPESPVASGETDAAEPVAEVQQPPAEPVDSPSPVSDPSAPSSADGMESPNWILTQNPDLYTIQMIASTSEAEVRSFLSEANLRGPNSIFTFQRSGVDWYALVHGLYESVEDARSAIIRMPDAALSFQPWIRSIARVQNSLRQ